MDFIDGILISAIAFCIFLIGCIEGQEIVQENAIEAGVAEYYVDEDYEKQFRFLEPEVIEVNHGPPAPYPAPQDVGVDSYTVDPFAGE